MNEQLLRVAAQALDAQRPYALATVVRRERPSSASPGNTAVITASGKIHGWIGGSCTQPEVVRHALAALRDAKPKLLAFSVTREDAGDPSPEGWVPVPMHCSSEGKVEIHINPIFPVPRLLVAGGSPVAKAIARLGRAMGYWVDFAGSESGGPATPAEEPGEGLSSSPFRRYAERPAGAKLVAVVATLGRSDEEAIEALMTARPDYLGVVASPTRMARIRTALVNRGGKEQEVARIRGPAGLDIGARTPEEVAVSILAEVIGVDVRWDGKDTHRGASAGKATEKLRTDLPDSCPPEPSFCSNAPKEPASRATDPVCGMEEVV